MKTAFSFLSTMILAAGLGLACGCALSPIPDLRTAADHAHATEEKCKSTNEDAVAAVLTKAAIDSTEPHYTYVNSASSAHEAHLRGVKIHLAPLPGATRESLARALECHQMRATLGRITPADDDPAFLPGVWLDIAVDSAGDGFTILITTDDFDDARKVVDRARRFAAR